jgi:hypothetical protein
MPQSTAMTKGASPDELPKLTMTKASKRIMILI